MAFQRVFRALSVLEGLSKRFFGRSGFLEWPSKGFFGRTEYPEPASGRFFGGSDFLLCPRDCFTPAPEGEGGLMPCREAIVPPLGAKSIDLGGEAQRAAVVERRDSPPRPQSIDARASEPQSPSETHVAISGKSEARVEESRLFARENMSHSESEIFVLQSVPKAVIDERERLPETHELIASAVGNSFHARGTNDLGMIEIWITDDGIDTSDACANSVWIEREYLAVPEATTPNKPWNAVGDQTPC